MNSLVVFGDLDMVQFCTRLAQARAQRGMTQGQVAWAAEIAEQSYGRIERGRYGLTAHTLYKLCQVLQVSADWLLGLDPLPVGSSTADEEQGGGE